MTTGFTMFDSPLGGCGIAWADHGVSDVALPERTEALTLAQLTRHHRYTDASTPPGEIQHLIDRILALLTGTPDDLRDVAIDVADKPQFDQNVWELTRAIDPGETTTYGAIAKLLGTPHASQQVGQALGRNPVPIIVPCHRVLAASGRIGGFSAPGGVSTKMTLLGLEGAAPNGQPALF